MNDDGLTEDQQRYLQGFVAGTDLARTARGLPTFANTLYRNGVTPPPAPGTAPAESIPGGPEAIHYQAQNRSLAEGKKLTAEEEAKRAKFPLDRWDELRARSQAGEFPKGIDVHLAKYFGLFFVAPAQNSYMCRLRLPAGMMSTHQFRGVAAIAAQDGGGYTHATTRANLQIREITAEGSIRVLTALQDLGIVPRGAGADNIRNITASPTAGIDPRELIDTRPLAREMHYYILNRREMYGLPASSTSASTAAGRSRCSRTRTTSASRPSGWPRRRSRRASISGWRWGDHRAPGLRAGRGGAAQARRMRAGRGGRRPGLQRAR
ncbi:MAG: hypothetical protein WKF75_18125 [Singulisphaera sp.]